MTREYVALLRIEHLESVKSVASPFQKFYIVNVKIDHDASSHFSLPVSLTPLGYSLLPKVDQIVHVS